MLRAQLMVVTHAMEAETICGLSVRSPSDHTSARLLSGLLAASHVRRSERASTTRPVQDRPVLKSGFHRLTLVFGLASVAVWTYVFNEW